jgi:dihydroneopterin aldolase
MSTLVLTTISVYFDRMIRSLSSAHNCFVDRILLEGMSFRGRHGVLPSEREQPQEFKVTVEVDCDLSEPGLTDRIEDTVDYRRIRTITKDVIEGESQKLLETLAARIAAGVLELPRVAEVSVRIAKRPESMQPIDAAAVRITRTRV